MPNHRRGWERFPEFKKWLSSSKKCNIYFHCNICFEDYPEGLTAVRKHSVSEKHKNMHYLYQLAGLTKCQI